MIKNCIIKRRNKHQNKLITQLLQSFLLISILPILIISFIAYTFCYNAILSNSISVSHEITDYTAEHINELQELNTRIYNSLIHSSEIQITMRYKDSNSVTNLITPFHINSTLSLIKSSSSAEINGIYCLSQNGLCYQSNTTTKNKPSYLNEDWYQSILKANKPIWISPYTGSLIIPNLDSKLFAYAAPYVDYCTQQTNGVILIEWHATSFFDNLRNCHSLKSNTYYLTDSSGHTLFTTDPSKPDYQYFKHLKNSNHYYERTLDNGWKIIGIISKNQIASTALIQLSIAIIIILLICIFFAILFSYRKAYQISEPIHKLITQMKIVQNGNYNIELPIPKSTDEIIALYQDFNKMIVKSNEYMKQIKYEQKKLRIANFKALQAQINPHFLYNTMDTIAWNIRLKENDRAINALVTLTKFFRSSLQKGADIITLEQEFEQVSLYLKIQMYRYDDMMDYSIDYSPDLKDFVLPKLTLQPIIENAIYHGIKNNEKFGHISICTKRYPLYYVIQVSDNGLGMTEQRLTELNNMLEHNTPIHSESSGYGIQNVNERIKIYFGTDYGLSFKSKLNVFTCAEIKLPYTIEKEQD